MRNPELKKKAERGPMTSDFYVCSEFTLNDHSLLICKHNGKKTGLLPVKSAII